MNVLKFKTFLLILSLSYSSYADEFWGLESWINSKRAPDFEKIADTQTRKTTFFQYLLPEIRWQNSKIIKLRQQIKNNQLSASKLSVLKKYYKLSDTASNDALLNAVDIVPASLVLAQAAYESNWGRSRFAKYYHNYFGLWCFKKGCGVVPLRRDQDDKHEVAKFSSLDKAIAYYFQSINRNSAYQTLRKIRKHKRDNNLTISGESLAEGLQDYAEIGHEYVDTVKAIIRHNQLDKYDFQI